jgi:hypothetical protein
MKQNIVKQADQNTGGQGENSSWPPFFCWEEVWRRTARDRRIVMNVMPFIPQADFAHLEAPSPELLETVCQQCPVCFLRATLAVRQSLLNAIYEQAKVKTKK